MLGQKVPPSDSLRDPSLLLVPSYPVLASPSRGRGQSLNAAVLRCCRCWRPSVSRSAWMTLTILDLGSGVFGDQARGRAAQVPDARSQQPRCTGRGEAREGKRLLERRRPGPVCQRARHDSRGDYNPSLYLSRSRSRSKTAAAHHSRKRNSSRRAGRDGGWKTITDYQNHGWME